MNNRMMLEYADGNGLTPLVWFNIFYPAYAVKVKYKYPTSDPADYRDRALLQLINLGISYDTACALLMIADPHKTILRRFKSDYPGPQLVRFDMDLNRDVLTPAGERKINQIELTREGMSCCFIDGYNGTPFPIDVVKNLTDRFCFKDVDTFPGGIYPFAADIEQKIIELNAKVTDGKGNEYQYKLGIPEGSRETSMSSLGPKWMTNLSIGIFLKGTQVVRSIFCDNSNQPVSPFGWLGKIDEFKLTVNLKKNKFYYINDKSAVNNVFTQDSLSDLQKLQKLIASLIGKEYGSEIESHISVEIDSTTSQCHIKINSFKSITRNRSRLLSLIEERLMPIQLNGLIGTLFLEVTADDEYTKELGELRQKINKSTKDLTDIINEIINKYPKDWRQILIDIDRHDLLFEYDVEHYITYGK